MFSLRSFLLSVSVKPYFQTFTSPVLLSAFLLFGVAFNINLQDLGETYVSRNMFGWVVIFLLTVHLWWQPLKSGTVKWSPVWLISLFTPVLGMFMVLAINILGGFEAYHPGHFFFPLMLLTFAFLILGLLQYEWDWQLKFTFMLVALICFMPQFIIHLMTANGLIFTLLPIEEISIPSIVYKPFAGFGQYNVYGSAFVTLIILAAAVFVFAPVSTKARIALMVPISLMAIDLPFSKSSTALLGLFFGLGFLAAHILIMARERVYLTRFAVYVGVLAMIALVVTVLLAMSDQTDKINELSAKRTTFSLNTRLTMWIVGILGFLDRPLFGHGLGSYLSIYMTQFAEHGLEKGLTFYPNVTIAHNLIIHVLSETGLFGFVAVLGPFIFLAVKVLQTADSRLLVLALLAPILVHTQLEYPYIASGVHYWLFAIAFVFGLSGRFAPERSFTFSPASPGLPFLAFGTLCLSAGIGIYVSISLALAAKQSAELYNSTRALSLDAFLEQRFSEPDVAHSILGPRVRAIAHLVIIQKAIQERRGDVLRDVSVPALENIIVPKYPTYRTWETALRVYVILRDRDRAMGLIDDMKKYDPEKAGLYETYVRQRLKLEPPKPQ